MNHRPRKHRTRRVALLTGAAAAALLALGAGPASAHVGTSVDEIPAGGRTALGLTIGHGCEESPTTAVAVQIPDGVNDAQAFAKPGWTVESEAETLDPPAESAHGEAITERIATITFTADDGNALPSDLRDTFTIDFTAPEAEGDLLFFKTVQSCEVGENRWIDEFDGEGEEPESPAPSVTVIAAEDEDEGGHGQAEEATTETTEAGETGAQDDGDEAAADSASTSEDSDSGSDGLAIAALVVGALGLITGGVALARTRKAPTA